MKEIEDKLKINKLAHYNDHMSEYPSNPQEEQHGSSHKDDDKSFLLSLLKSIVTFLKIVSTHSWEFVKKHKYKIFFMIILWILASRNRFKNKLLSLLRINFWN